MSQLNLASALSNPMVQQGEKELKNIKLSVYRKDSDEQSLQKSCKINKLFTTERRVSFMQE